jgi:hypothetical protein
MNKAKEMEIKFKLYAFKKGFTHKVVDNAYQKSRNPNSKIIRMISVKKGKILVYEDGVGQYEI